MLYIRNVPWRNPCLHLWVARLQKSIASTVVTMQMRIDNSGERTTLQNTVDQSKSLRSMRVITRIDQYTVCVI